MKKKMLLLAVLFISTGLVFAAVDFARIDDLYFHSEIDEVQRLLETALDSGISDEEKVGVLWRLARNCIDLGDRLPDDAKKEKYATFEKGEAFADQSIALKETPEGYIWKSSNIGRWGQTKGPLNSLAKAEPMRELLTKVVNDFKYLESSDVWYVIGCLYDQLPGMPISFGNSNMGLSYMRLAVKTIPSWVWYGGTYQYLAEALYKRNWSDSKRNSEFPKIEKKYEKTKGSQFKKLGYYEGSLDLNSTPVYASRPLGKMSDREEAVAVLRYALKVYENRDFHTKGDVKNYEEINALLDSWT
ncbi:MAG: hypothetical protein GXZ16_02130 [Spirochaetales bacterium]|jgi:hypothetical protein|nr:hypothetical protein [Spirochaetales bacterium]